VFLHRGFLFYLYHHVFFSSGITALTDAADQHLYLLCNESPGQLDGWYIHLFQTYRIAAGIADEVYMVVLMMTAGTIVFTQRITYRIIRSRYIVDQSLL
jgi:hypothetical protein